MLQARVLPDEFISGFGGRLRILNFYSSSAELIRALRLELHTSKESGVVYPPAVILSIAAAVPVQQFICCHSLLPLHCAVTHTGAIPGRDNSSRLDLIALLGMRLFHSSGARFCRDCIGEDINNLGFAYWRRSHQLPGVLWCDKHGLQLARAAGGKKAYDELPAVDMATDPELSESEFSKVFANPVVRRYTQIINRFTTSEHSISSAQARLRISERASNPNQRCRKRLNGALTLAERAFEEIPMSWLLSEYPRRTDQGRKGQFSPINGVFKGSASALSYALALALLFDSAEEALDYWFLDSNTPTNSVTN